MQRKKQKHFTSEFGTADNSYVFRVHNAPARRSLSSPRPISPANTAPAPKLHKLAPKTFYFGSYTTTVHLGAGGHPLHYGTKVDPRPYDEFHFVGHKNWFTLPQWFNETPVEQGGFVGEADKRKNIYDLYGTVYDPKKRNDYPPGWFGFRTDGTPVAFATIQNKGKQQPVTGREAYGVESVTLARYPYLDKPPNWNPPPPLVIG